ncbi:PhzF family phenazine biosynthesis protein [Cnuibacter physcomitrellae]|uniref:PhzF family phenazine biosynthesis protein n=1 Tax=Cnuibacter physcomitrellae TaxID=1619308 RepID=UPI0021757830|nr:PhzF family phenazine biosynthesis protein [Cnuibacter physcomitrellae]MCS5498029.1 PhzF family phenazine biosynthesis protein [Cnuibacter physcomitrellae]
MVDVLRMTAFPEPGAADGGNPAGVVLEAGGLDDAAMLRLAAEVGYSETAFVREIVDDGAVRRVRIRYFSPEAEVPFCGHATIATAVALAKRDGAGELLFETPAGDVAIATSTVGGEPTAAFTSVEPRLTALDDAVLGRLLDLLGLTAAQLDPAHPPRAAFAGNVHPIVVVADRATFDGFGFDPRAMRALMDEQGWAGTVTVLHPLVAGAVYEARNLFPVGEITEDPATGSAAASTGAYLRELGVLTPPAEVEIRQGAHVGRPSLLRVTVPPTGGIVVRGTAAALPRP